MIHNIEDFISWIDMQLNESIPNEIIAFNINIYESPFNIEIVGSNEFDLEDEGWACNEDWIPENRFISVSNSLFGNSWESAQENIVSMAKQYLNANSENVVKLQQAQGFAVGFVDGNLTYVK
ncbi:hypothetical protein [Motilimonas pumila]|uniref:Uncharacterized protein n=1 Tax=Motilimonas pumila TaxID=2303987 RepID=A0A418Y8Z3_9GAMM|nr:hypothetical protein [Motilimonas pumila]RJG35874.1 hypothetical protein D1Z90_20720 [Motilimonas pumila]